MGKDNFIKNVFQAVDNGDAVGLTNLMTDDAVFRFSNNPAVVGKANIIPFLGGFFQSIKGLSHQLEDSWEVQDGFVMNGTVTYTRHDDSTYVCKFSNTFKMQEGKIQEYLIFVDNSQLYNN